MNSKLIWFAKIDENGIQYIEKKDGTKISHRMKNRKEFKEQFTNEIQLPLSKTSEQYKKALDNIIFEQSLKETIAKLSWKFANDGQERPLILDREIFEHIFKRHGDFMPDNLLETANAPDYFIKNITIDGIVYPDKINLVKQVPNADKVWIIGAERQNGFFILTHLEVAEKNVLEKVLAKGELIKLK